MELIVPSLISGEIFKIIDEAEESLIIVSPYINITNWPKLTNRLKSVLKRNVDLKVFVRDGQKNLKSFDELQKLGITPFLIPNLHAKLYFNENQAVTSSMNLLKSSDQYSLEIAHKTQSHQEFQEIVDYYEKYIGPHTKNLADFKSTLEDEIYNRFENIRPKLKVYSNFDSLDIYTGYNRFDVEINREDGSNFIEIVSILSKKEFDYRNKFLENNNLLDDIELEFISGNDNQYDLIVGLLNKSICSKRISDVLNNEKRIIADFIYSFIDNIESFKESVR